MMVGNNLKDTQLQQIVDKTILFADKDEDGKISFEEFCAVSVFRCFVNIILTPLFVGVISLIFNRPIQYFFRSSEIQTCTRRWSLMFRCIYSQRAATSAADGCPFAFSLPLCVSSVCACIC